VGVTVASLAGGDPVHFAQIAALAGICVGVLCLVAWALRLSTLTSFISETILLGFKAGAGLSIAATQLPNLLGVPGGGDHFLARLAAILHQAGNANPVTLAIGMTALVLLLLGERFLPGRPVALLVVVLSIVAVSVLSLTERGVATAGTLPAGLPGLWLPEVRVRDVDGVIPLAAACLLLAFVESASAARTFAAKHGYPSTCARSCSAWERPTSPSASATAIRWPAACRSRR